MRLKNLFLFLFIAFTPLLFADDVSGPGGTVISQFLDEATPLARRSKVNWTGAGVSCVDNPTLKQLDCTVTSSGSGGGGSTSLVVRYNSVLVSSPTSTLNFMPPLIVTLQGSTSAQISLSPISLSTGVVGSVDISTQTNLQAVSPLILTNDTISISAISLSTGVVGPLIVSSGTVTDLNTTTLKFNDGTTQTTAAVASAGDITAVISGSGLTGGSLSGNATLSLDPSATNYIHNQDTLQSGATAYPQFLKVGTAGAIISGPLNLDGVITASNTVITTAAGLLDANKLTNTVPNASLDTSSITKMGNTFNGASQLVKTDGSSKISDSNLSANVSLLGSQIDISAETNLSAQSPLSLSDDTITIDTNASSGNFILNRNTLQSGATFFVERGIVNSRIGIATDTPQAPLHILGSAPAIRMDTQGVPSFFNQQVQFYTGPAGSLSLSGSFGWQGTGTTGFGTQVGLVATDVSDNVLLNIPASAGTTQFTRIANGIFNFGGLSQPYFAIGSGDSTASANAHFYRVSPTLSSATIALPNMTVSATPSFQNLTYVFCKTDSSTNTVDFVATGDDVSPTNATLRSQNECVMLISTVSGSVGSWSVQMKNMGHNAGIYSSPLGMNFGGTVTSSSNTVITSTGSLSAMKITANGTYGTTAATSGGLLVDCTGGGSASGFCAQFYTNATTQTALGGIINIIQDLAGNTWNEPGLYVKMASTNGGAANLRLDGPVPQIEWVENDQVSPAGKYEDGVNGDIRYIAGRKSDNSGFENFINFTRPGATASATQSFFSVNDSTGRILISIDRSGHVITQSTQPALSSCGTSPTLSSNSNDRSGTVTVGATASGCTVTFANAYASAPTCVVSERTMSLTNSLAYTTSTSALTLTETTFGGVIFDYICEGH